MYRTGSEFLVPHLSDRFLALVTVLVLAAALLGGLAAYVANPLLPYAAVAEQTPGTFGAEGQFSRAAKANVSEGTLYRQDKMIDAPAATTISPPAAAVLIAIPLPVPRPNHLPGVSSGLLNDAQINGIKNRLALSPAQAEHWPAVEAALREVARRHLRSRRAPKIDGSSPEVQRLIDAAVPLIGQLREDQKREVRQLVRMIGLDKVASQI